MLESFSNTHSKGLEDFFEDASRSYETKDALVLETGESMKYQELDSLATNIQQIVYHTIREQHISDTSLVSVMIDRSFAFVVAMLGILKAGAAYVPVDPSFPRDRQLYIFTHSKCGFLIVDEASFEAASSFEVELPSLIKLDSRGQITYISNRNLYLSPKYNQEEIRAFRCRCAHEKLAYVLYTSGSTGKPKGVMVKNAGVVNIINWFADELNINSSSRVLGLSTFCFDISVLEMFVALTRGATLVLAKTSTQKDPFYLVDLMKRERISVFQATPTTYEMLLATGWTGDSEIDFLVGGEAFRPSLLPVASNCRSFRNVYGPTETTIWSTSYTITAGWAREQAKKGGAVVVPIGVAISETYLYLVTVEAPHIPVSDGSEGELWIGGVGVARGYVHAPDLTAQRFLPNPFGPGFVYCTGDVVRRQLDGSGQYVFVRRIDDQVKIGGFRIELQEVEAVYGEHEAVDQAVALVRNGAIIIYLKMKVHGSENTPGLLESVHNRSSQTLTYYMMPKSTVIVSNFPQTANGKLDRKALPDPTAPIKCTQDVFPKAEHESLPQGTTELTTIQRTIQDREVSVVARHISDVVYTLRGYRPGLLSSFASIGVDSLGAIVFVKQLSDCFGGLKIAPSAVFSPGVTVFSLAVIMINRLKAENPFILENMINDAGDAEIGLHSKSDDVDGDKEIVRDFDVSFDNLLVRSRDYLEGIRGWFTFMVLWDHFSPLVIASGWNTDTALFVMISGFTTSLQLRSAPKIFKNKNGDIIQKPREPFNWSSFLLSKAIAIFPVLWIALLLCIPLWTLDDSPDKAGCAVLYVVGLQSWWRPNCHLSGPNNLLYASIIWSIFIIYCLVRFVLDRSQNYFLKKLPQDPTGFKKHFMGTVYNRPEDWPFNYSWFTFQLGLIALCLWLCNTFALIAKNAVTFLPYFLAGVFAACAMEVNLYIQRRWYLLVDVSLETKESADRMWEQPLYRILQFMWRFLPDLSCVAIGLQLSTIGDLGDLASNSSDSVRNSILPLTFLILIVVGVMQVGDSRLNISQFVFKSPVMTFLGYISFPAYLFQLNFMSNYMRYITTGTIHPTPGWTFQALPFWQRLLAVLFCLAFSWVVQKYVVDSLSVYIYQRMQKYRPPSLLEPTKNT